MNWTEPILLECEFPLRDDRRRIRIRVSFPRRVDESEWACAFQLLGWRDNRVRVAHGVDGVQALLIATTALRKSLDKIRKFSAGSEPYEFILPKVVPMSYGLDFHRHLCSILDREIEKKEKELSRKRLSRKRPK